MVNSSFADLFKGDLKMRFLTCVLVATSVCGFGCYTETNITRTVKHTNGSVEVYENKSNGYNYNPNFTGTAEQSVHVRDYGFGYGYGPYGGYGGVPVAPVMPVVVPNYGQYGYPY
jgi:hypothetical protein